VDFTLTYTNASGGAYTYPHFSSCSFSVQAKNADSVKFVSGPPTSAEGWGSTTAANENVGYICAGN
jgi:hypothetical protein